MTQHDLGQDVVGHGIGRGAGCILPRESTLNVRVVAALEERIAYMAQWLRLTAEEAAERVRLRQRFFAM